MSIKSEPATIIAFFELFGDKSDSWAKLELNRELMTTVLRMQSFCQTYGVGHTSSVINDIEFKAGTTAVKVLLKYTQPSKLWKIEATLEDEVLESEPFPSLTLLTQRATNPTYPLGIISNTPSAFTKHLKKLGALTDCDQCQCFFTTSKRNRIVGGCGFCHELGGSDIEFEQLSRTLKLEHSVAKTRTNQVFHHFI